MQAAGNKPQRIQLNGKQSGTMLSIFFFGVFLYRYIPRSNIKSLQVLLEMAKLERVETFENKMEQTSGSDSRGTDSSLCSHT